MKRDTCPLCGSSEVSDFLREARDYVTGDRFDVLRCRRCEVRFTFPQPENIEIYYPGNYRRYTAWVLIVLKTLYNFQVYRWRKLFKKSGSALEMGCGDGLMLDALRRKGWMVAGTERTQEMAEFGRNTLGLQVYVGGLGEIPQGQKFDLIILFQVLEHLNDPVTVIKQCADLLAPDGKLIIAVPNSRSWQSRYSGASWFHLDVPRHLFHFSPTSLQYALNIAGLTISTIRYASFEHDPYGWVQSILNKEFDNQNKLTRLLMNLDRFTSGHIVALVMSSVLIIPGLFVSIASWLSHSGAIMQVVSSHKNATNL